MKKALNVKRMVMNKLKQQKLNKKDGKRQEKYFMNRYFKSQFDPGMFKTEMEIWLSDIYNSDRPLFFKAGL